MRRSVSYAFNRGMNTVEFRAIEKAKAKLGGSAELARRLGITTQAVSQWHRCPAERVLEVERLTGVPRHQLRPTLYPKRLT